MQATVRMQLAFGWQQPTVVPQPVRVATAPSVTHCYCPLLLPSSSRQATERMKFVFDWDANEDTSRDLNPLYQNLHGAAARWAVHSG